MFQTVRVPSINLSNRGMGYTHRFLSLEEKKKDKHYKTTAPKHEPSAGLILIPST
jgi:hypothetical protein